MVVTGNEDGAHHVISELAGALVDIGFTVPGQSWTYCNLGRRIWRLTRAMPGWPPLVGRRLATWSRSPAPSRPPHAGARQTAASTPSLPCDRGVIEIGPVAVAASASSSSRRPD
jgi:hypothetical protein